MTSIALIIAGSEIISLFLIIKLWKSDDYLVFKLLISGIVLIPILGPLLYLFVTDRTPPQHRCLQNRGPRGQYTHTWITMKPLYKKYVEERRKEIEGEDRDT